MNTRRQLFVSAGALLFGACARAKAGPTACNGTGTLKEEELQARTALAYVDHASAPEKSCEHCVQWVAPPEPTSCGACKLLKGPIHPGGSCAAFSPQG